MVEKLVKKLKSIEDTQNAIDPSYFDDPIAMETEWNAVLPNEGSNFQTRTLVKVNPDRLKFRATFTIIFYLLIFLLVGMGILAYLFVYAELSFDVGTIIPMLLGFMFTSAGSYMLYTSTTPITFDKWQGVFWKGWKYPNDLPDKQSPQDFAKLEDVHAIQIIYKYTHGSNSSYESYELNLVLKDATRINVIDHGYQDKIREDADTLSAFLSKPVWDASLLLDIDYFMKKAVKKFSGS